MNNDKQPSSLGFEDELDNLDTNDWTPNTPGNDKSSVDEEKVRKVAEKQGFTSREPKASKTSRAANAPSKARPKRQKEPTDAINFRAKISVLEKFRGIGEEQEPEWSLGYTLERAMAALERELKG